MRRLSIAVACAFVVAFVLCLLGLDALIYRHIRIGNTGFSMCTWLAGILAVLLATMFAMWLIRRIALRLTAVDRGLAAFAAGRLDGRLEVGGNSEIDRIANSANRLAERIRHERTAERELIAGLAHDLAHPLTAIRNTLEAAREGLTVGIDPEAAKGLLGSVESVEATLGDLRDVAAFDAGFIRLEWTRTNLAEVVREAVARYSDVAFRRGVTLRDDVDGSLFVMTDRRRLERIIANLSMNALAATAPGGFVHLRAGSRGRDVDVSVEDTAGPEAAQRLRTALRDGVREGLGVRVVRSLSSALHARLSLETTAEGSIVRLQFDDLKPASANAICKPGEANSRIPELPWAMARAN